MLPEFKHLLADIDLSPLPNLELIEQQTLHSLGTILLLFCLYVSPSIQQVRSKSSASHLNIQPLYLIRGKRPQLVIVLSLLPVAAFLPGRLIRQPNTMHNISHITSHSSIFNRRRPTLIHSYNRSSTSRINNR